MRKIGSHARRIAPLTVFFAALIEFAIERARFDLWIMTVGLMILFADALGRTLLSRVDSEKPDHHVSVSRR
jgi:hypothetical protein